MGPARSQAAGALPLPLLSAEALAKADAAEGRGEGSLHQRDLARGQSPHHPVIASAAKQSRISPRRISGLLRCARN